MEIEREENFRRGLPCWKQGRHYFAEACGRTVSQQSPLGRVVWINSQPVEIIGVLKEETGLLALGMNEMYVPFQC
ncbi:ABC transporter permease [Bacillus licheniformis]|nr:ABC transporter permease [Bacillus licheniformis]